MNYQLLATDMDGTLLNDQKGIPQNNIDAINEALEAGKDIVFSSGRCIDEMADFYKLFPKMKYSICESGASIYDIQNDTCISTTSIDKDSVKYILEYVQSKKIMIQAMGHGHMAVSDSDMRHLKDFKMAQYQEHFESTGTIVDSAFDYVKEDNWYAEKICLYHTSADEREITKAKFAHLPVVLAYSEETSLEVSPLGIDKGIGLQILCKHLNLSTDETIAVGDSYNDIPILEVCGLPVAVANSRDEVLEVCQVTVADNNQGGVAEAIEKYML